MAGPNSVVLQERDRTLLAYLRLLRVIDRELAEQLAPFGSIPRANARLLQLTRAGYLKRSFVGTIAGGRKAVYRLPGVRVRRGRAEVIEHRLQVNELFYLFAVRPAPDGICVRWQGSVSVPAATIIPDGLALIERDEEIIRCFIEADRGTETLSVIGRKIDGYLALARSGSFPPFRVLITTTSTRRRENIRKLAAKRTHRIFFLAVFDEVKSLGPWAAVWHRPGSTGGVQLI